VSNSDATDRGAARLTDGAEQIEHAGLWEEIEADTERKLPGE
jgi:hypothetical protein